MFRVYPRRFVIFGLLIVFLILLYLYYQSAGLSDVRLMTGTHRGVMRMVSGSSRTSHHYPWIRLEAITKACKQENFYRLGALPTASVVISFHNAENISTVLHTVHSIFQRSPSNLLAEIILIDDNTKKDDLKEVLLNYVHAVFVGKVSVYRSEKLLGLIQARLLGIRVARGSVIVCMDSHMEVQEGWLEPLLFEIKKNRKTLAASYLDWMEKKDDVWQYTHGGITWVTNFDWSLAFGFQEFGEKRLKNKGPTEAIESPVTVGGIFAISKSFFEDIGAYDPDMEKWGGENIDLPVRVWLFGGRVVNVPCSKAAHLEYPGNRDYRSGWESTIHRNYKRFAEVWMDEYKEYFYDIYPQLKEVDAGNLDKRRALKTKCPRNFTWYLETVYPELGLADRDSFAWGGLTNVGYNKCLDTLGTLTPGVWECRKQPSQSFYWSRKLELRMPTHTYMPDRINKRLSEYDIFPNYNDKDGLKWIHWKSGPMRDTTLNLCLEVINSTVVDMRACNMTNVNQLWQFKYYTDSYRGMMHSRDGQYRELRAWIQSLRPTGNTRRSRRSARVLHGR